LGGGNIHILLPILLFLKKFSLHGTHYAALRAVQIIKITRYRNNNNTFHYGPGWGSLLPPQFPRDVLGNPGYIDR
jgi:hypothetical protein